MVVLIEQHDTYEGNILRHDDMVVTVTCPNCHKVTQIPTQEGVPKTNQRCATCGFRLPDLAQRPLAKSSDFGD